MSAVVITGNTSGSITLNAPDVAGTTTLNLPTVSGGTLVTSDSSGNVGIGTASPAGKLGVSDGTVQLVTSPFGAGLTGYLGTSTDHALAFITNSVERGRFDTSGLFQFNSGYGSVATAYGCRAWVNFNGEGTVAIRASGNVSSITDNGTGNYTVNFTTAMPDANYVVTDSLSGGGSVVSDTMGGAYLYSTSSFTLNTRQGNNTQADRSTVSCAVFR